MIVKLLVTIIALLISSNMLANNKIKGIITDSIDNNILSGVVIALKNEKGAIIEYTISDNDGHFELNNSDNRINYHIEISFMGYKTIIINPPFPEIINISLKVDVSQIKEVIIKAEKVKMRGDTISYSIPSIKSTDDRNLSDLLKKLPGIEVAKGGFVYYQGKPINKLYIDGKDILGDKYNIATLNIDPNLLSKLEIYENHQYIKALEGISTSEQAAINITLKDNARNIWITNLQLLAGISSTKPRVPYSANGFVMNINKRFQTMNTLKTDAAGNIISNKEYADNVYIVGQEKINLYKLNNYSNISVDNAPLENERTRFNVSYSASSDNRFEVGKDLIINMGVNFFKNKLTSSMAIKNSYLLNNGTSYTYSEINNKSFDNNNISASIGLDANTKKMYLKESFNFEYNDGKGKGIIDGSEQRNQFGNKKEININNVVNFLFRLKGGKTFGFKMNTQYSEKSSYLEINKENEVKPISQIIDSKVFYNIITFNVSKQFNKHFSLLSLTSIEYTNRRLNSLLDGFINSNTNNDIDTTNNVKMNIFNPSEYIYLRFNNRKIETFIGMDFRYQYLDYFTDKNHNGNKLAANPFLSFKYIISPKISFMLNGSYSLSKINEQSIYNALIMENYRYLSEGRSSLVQTPNYSASAEINFREPISGWYIKLDANYSGGENFLRTSYFIGDHIINKESDNTSIINGWYSGMTISKGIFDISGKIDAKFSFNKYSSSVQYNENKTNYDSYKYSGTFNFVGDIFKWWKIKYNALYSFNNYMANGEWTKEIQHSFKQNYSLSFFPIKSLEIDIIGEHYLDKYSNSNIRQIFLLDFSIWYFLNSKIQLFLHGKNLLNHKNYSFSTLNPLNTIHYSYVIRPLNVMVGIDFKF